MSGWACGVSPAWPAVRKKRTGQPKPRTAMWIFCREAAARTPDGLILSVTFCAAGVLVGADDGGAMIR